MGKYSRLDRLIRLADIEKSAAARTMKRVGEHRELLWRTMTEADGKLRGLVITVQQESLGLSALDSALRARQMYKDRLDAARRNLGDFERQVVEPAAAEMRKVSVKYKIMESLKDRAVRNDRIVDGRRENNRLGEVALSRWFRRLTED